MGWGLEGNRKVGKQVEKRKLGLSMYEKLHGKLLFYKLSYTYVYACTRECVCACVCVLKHIKEYKRPYSTRGQYSFQKPKIAKWKVQCPMQNTFLAITGWVSPRSPQTMQVIDIVLGCLSGCDGEALLILCCFKNKF